MSNTYDARASRLRPARLWTLALCVLVSTVACGGPAEEPPADGLDSGLGTLLDSSFPVDAAVGNADAGELDAGEADFAGTIVFPPPSATIAESIRVHGTLTTEGIVSDIRIGGVSASSTDGFATWSAEVPLESGVNELVAVASTVRGERSIGGVEVMRFASFDELTRGETTRFGEIGHDVFSIATHLSYDSSEERVFVSAGGGIWAIDLASGDQWVVTQPPRNGSDPGVGFGESFGHARDIQFDPTHARLYVRNAARGDAPDTVFLVDIDSGERSVLPGLEGVTDFRVSADGLSLFVAMNENKSLIRYDIATQDVEVISDESRGEGEEFGRYGPVQIAVDEEHGRALASQVYGGNLFAIDLVSGDRSVLSTRSDGIGAMGWPNQLALSHDRSEVFFLPRAGSIRGDDETLYAIHLETGAHRAIDMPDDGINMVMTSGIEVYPHGILYLSVWGIYCVDPMSGERVMVSGRPIDPEVVDGRRLLHLRSPGRLSAVLSRALRPA